MGKSFVACALAQEVCRGGYSALYTRAQSLFRDLAMARADGSLRSLPARLSRSWHEQIGDPTLADRILDRLVHNAHRIEMRGHSLRKNRGKASAYRAHRVGKSLLAGIFPVWALCGRVAGGRDPRPAFRTAARARRNKGFVEAKGPGPRDKLIEGT